MLEPARSRCWRGIVRRTMRNSGRSASFLTSSAPHVTLPAVSSIWTRKDTAWHRKRSNDRLTRTIPRTSIIWNWTKNQVRSAIICSQPLLHILQSSILWCSENASKTWSAKALICPHLATLRLSERTKSNCFWSKRMAWCMMGQITSSLSTLFLKHWLARFAPVSRRNELLVSRWTGRLDPLLQVLVTKKMEDRSRMLSSSPMSAIVSRC